MKITILGCGASLGTPAPGGFWGACDPNEPKNERTRTSILIQSDKTNLLVDAGFDTRIQLNRIGLKRLDGLLLTHAHADHINGLSDMRIFSYTQKQLIDTYSNAETFKDVYKMAGYAFEEYTVGTYKPFLNDVEIGNYDKFTVGDIDLETFEQDHFSCTSLGIRVGNFAYSVDVAYLSEKSLEALKGVDTWVVGCAGYHRTDVTNHANLEKVMEWVNILKPRLTYLTVLTTKMDYKTLCEELPQHVRPAYDGLVIES